MTRDPSSLHVTPVQLLHTVVELESQFSERECARLCIKSNNALLSSSRTAALVPTQSKPIKKILKISIFLIKIQFFSIEVQGYN
ncbi:hypothetical protein Hanom_Chr03g00264971 [Helianthus anomalus]